MSAKSAITLSRGLAPRRAALHVLAQVRAGRPLDAALDGALRSLDEPDRRLAHEMAAGVFRRQGALDSRLAPLVTRDWGQVPERLQDVLRLGAYQLLELDRVPPHAAVDTSVSLAREEGGPRAGGFVNAVLRRLGALPEPAPRAVAPDAAALAESHSHPLWLVERWLERFGPEETRKLLEWNDRKPRLVLQPAREGLADLERRWQAAGIATEPAPFGAGLMTDRRRPEELPGFAEGAFMVQDPAPALLTWYADLPPDATLYDAAASPGGKTIALGREARMVVAGDVNRLRVRRLADNLRRAGSGHEYAMVADAHRPPLRQVGAVLLDAPCLGTGTFARHPDARARVTAEALDRVQGLQAELLERTSEVVAPGGLLLYSTCSLEPEENERQVERFLARRPGFRREPNETFPPALMSEDGDLSILPQRHEMDGAYAARLRRA
ncbi:MAG: 16S rRNA (cytosine(967)-C(5))-methyltransferase RsmB [Gemmatimonadales bacterium]|nr:16S rRNA (cytosine(967)-C(5))-methyltransferase RsmB [Gemmatimonadales bacterium]